MKKLYLLFCIPCAIFAQDLKELVQLSIQNEIIVSEQHNKQALEYAHKGLQKDKLPSATMNANYANTLNENISSPKNVLGANLQAHYQLYDGGNLNSSLESYRAKIKSAEENIQASKNNLALQTISHYFNYQSLVSQREVIKETIANLNTEHQRIQKFLQTGMTTKDELYLSQLTIESESIQHHEIDVQMQNILHSLLDLTGQRASITKGSSIKEVASLVVEVRPDIKALQYDVQDALHSAKASKSSQRPNVSLDNIATFSNANYSSNDYSDETQFNNQISLNLSWQIFDFGASSNRYQSLYAQYLSLNTHYEYEKKKAQTALELSNKVYETTKLKINLAKTRLKVANVVYEMTKAKYDNHIIDYLVYLDALSKKQLAISELEKTKNELEIHKATIIYYSGKNLKEYIQ